MIWIYILIGIVVEFLVIVFAVALVGINKEVVFRRGECPDCGDKLLDLGKGVFFCRSCAEVKDISKKDKVIKKKTLKEDEEIGI